jgi:hypothetical protein
MTTRSSSISQRFSSSGCKRALLEDSPDSSAAVEIRAVVDELSTSRFQMEAA